MKSIQILLVEDNPGDSRLIRETLKEINELDCQVAHTNSLAGAQTELTQKKFDVILLDLGLPDSMGLESLTTIQQCCKDIPVVVLTGYSDEKTALQAVQMGAQDYLFKGQIDPPLLGRALMYAIERQRMLGDLVDKMEQIREAENKINNMYLSLMQDLKTASQIQKYLLPPDFLLRENIQFCSNYTPSSKVGGDFYDIIRVTPTRYYVCIGDISGHGVQAALLMAAIRSMLNYIVETSGSVLSPWEIVNRLSNLLSRSLLRTNYLTLILGYVDLDLGEFRYLNAGHPPVLLYDPVNQKASILKDNGNIPIGWIADYEYSEKDEISVPLQSGCIFILYTDGIYECEDASGRQLGLEGVVELLEMKIQTSDCLLLPHRIKEYMLLSQYNLSQDDFAILAFEPIQCRIQEACFILPARNDVYISPTEMECALCFSCVRDVQEIGERSQKVVYEWTGNQEYAWTVELVVNEFINNILYHGYNKELVKDIILLIQHEDAIVLRFIDAGKPWAFNLNLGQDIKGNYSAKIQDLPESGWGMKIVESQAAGFTRNRLDTYNETIIRLKLPER